jgi:membrane-associated phospholipid phosphatase
MMRASEWVQIGFSFGLAALAWLRPLEMRRRWRVALLAVAVAGAILIARFLLHGYLSSIVRDWLAAVLLLFPYWQAGHFFTRPDKRIEERLGRIDERVMKWLAKIGWSAEKRAWATYFESVYLMCYPLVPVSLGILYVTHHRAAADFYWLVVVIASDICFAATIFVPAMPPRLVREFAAPPERDATDVRKLNLAVLNRGSIQAITFPSAHVASTMAAALVLTRFLPATGAIFLAIAVSIAIGAFLGRYHYFLDVVLGAAEALIVFLICVWVMRP